MEPVIDPPKKTDATFQKRLIGFKTGEALLRDEHQTWLRNLANKTNTTLPFTCHIYGFASKIGKHETNKRLSYDRANAVAAFLEKMNALYTLRIDQFVAEGDEGYKAPLGDNDPLWRAVEVHVFMGNMPVLPKPGVTPIIPPTIRRTGLQWSVSGTSLGTQSNPMGWLPAQVALNQFSFRNDETLDTGTFLAPMAGAGWDVFAVLQAKLKEIADLKGKIANVDQLLIKLAARIMKRDIKLFWYDLLNFMAFDLSFTPTEFTKAKVFLPLTMNKLAGATISNAAVALIEWQYGNTFVSDRTWYTDVYGKKMFGMRDFLAVPFSWSTQFQVPNIGASFLGGPLIRIK